jgi:hypothetical protein
MAVDSAQAHYASIVFDFTGRVLDSSGFQTPASSCPRLSRASTSSWRRFSAKGVDGRDKPGHDEHVN